MTPLEMLAVFTIIAFFTEPQHEHIDGRKDCVVNTDKCYKHEDLQRPDGLLDVEKYRAAQIATK